MSTQPSMLGRREELRRRVKALPKEVKDWQQRSTQNLDLNAHHSQLQALGVLMGAFDERQRAVLKQMDAQGDAEVFRVKGLELVKEIIRAQKTWDFFRDKLELRFSPDFKDPLWIADTVAWDCYRPVLESAADDGILSHTHLREPPLCYLTAEFSPATWVRGTRPYDGRDYALGTATLPIPVIELPWDHMQNLWELLSIHHEVGHDLEADLKLRDPLKGSLQMELAGANVPAQRIHTWVAWTGEVVADLMGLHLAGPAFCEALMHLLLLPAAQVTQINPTDPHPTHYVRILMNTAYARTLVPGRQELIDDCKRFETTWRAHFGDQPQFRPYVDDFPLVFKALMETPFMELKNKALRDLMPFTSGDDANIRAAAAYLGTGQNAPARGSIRPRHCVSAARLAVATAAQGGAGLDARLQTINERTAKLVRDNAPPGLRAGDASPQRRKFIAGYAATL